MQDTFLIFLRVLFSTLFAATLFAGVYLSKNSHRLFGIDADMPSENSSSRTYTKLQVTVVWAHLLLLTGAFALMIH